MKMRSGSNSSPEALRLLAFATTLLLIWAAFALNEARANPPTATVLSSPNPVDIYEEAVARLRTLPSAPYLEYVMRQVNTTPDGVVALALDETIRERRRDRSSWNLVTASVPSNRGWQGDVMIGRHYLVPDAFLPGTTAASAESTGLLPGLDSDTALPVIATVHSTASPSYAITLVDQTNVANCGNVAHLSLSPLRDPERYNLRELWIRTSDYMLCKAVYNSHLYGDDPRRPHTSMVITATLNDDGLITSWVSNDSSLDFGGLYRTNEIGEFFNVVWSDAEPDYFFDRKLWDARKAAPLPTAPPQPHR